MAVNVTELLALPHEERLRLAEMLMESTVPPDIGPLLRDFVVSLERTNRTLEAALERLSTFDERLERVRVEAREAAIGSGDAWPFPLPQ